MTVSITRLWVWQATFKRESPNLAISKGNLSSWELAGIVHSARNHYLRLSVKVWKSFKNDVRHESGIARHHQAVRGQPHGPVRHNIPNSGPVALPRDPGASLRQLPHGRAHVESAPHLRRPPPHPRCRRVHAQRTGAELVHHGHWLNHQQTSRWERAQH